MSKALLPIVGVVFIAFTVIGLALPVLPLHVHQGLGLGTFVVGLVAGAQFAASLLSRFWSGAYADGVALACATKSRLVLEEAPLRYAICRAATTPTAGAAGGRMGKFLLVGAEHLNALREQVVWGLAGAATYMAYEGMPTPAWLDIEGISPPKHSPKRDNFWGVPSRRPTRKPVEGVIEASAEDLEIDPPLWAYFEKPAQNQVERQRIFSRIFGFDRYPLHKQLVSLYEIRNEIAHGRAPTLVTLSKFAQCTKVAFSCMRHLSDEAESKQRVMI